MRPESLEAALVCADGCGFPVSAMPMRFGDGMEMRRVTKLEHDETLTLDLVLADDNLEQVWETRQ